MHRRSLLLLGPLVVVALVIAGSATADHVGSEPTIDVAGPATVQATDGDGEPLTFSVTASDDDDDPDPVPTCDQTAGTNIPVDGSITVTCSVIDLDGHVASDFIVQNVIDTTPPAFSNVPGPLTVTAGDTVTYPPPTASDAVDGPVPVTCDPASPFTASVTVVVECNAVDAHMNDATPPATFTVTVQPANTAPVLTLPGPITVEATSSAGAAVNFSALVDATDAEDDPDPMPNCSRSSGTFQLGTTQIDCSVTDSGGLADSGSFDVVVRDTTPPTVSVPASMTVQPTSSAGATVSFAVTASDLVDQSPEITCDHLSPGSYGIGLTTVLCHAEDDAHNVSADVGFSISVQDADAPVVTVPASRTVEANGPNGAIVNYETPTATTVDGPRVASCTKASGSVFPLGTTVVTCSATDGGGRTGSAAFTIAVADTTPPVLTVPADLTIQSSSAVPAGNSAIKDFLGGATATDIVDNNVAITHNAPATFPLGTTTVVFTAEDDAGNSRQKSAVVTITTQPVAPPAATDTTPPDNVRGVKAIAGNLSVAIAWRVPRARDFHHVTITRAPGRNGAPETLVYRGKKKTFVARGLKDGVEYRFVIVAYDEAGNRAAGVAVVVFAEQQNLLVPVNGARISAPRRFAWRPVPGADYYNIQFWHDGKQLSAWPAKPRFMLPGSWRFEGKPHKLVPGTWLVYVWAGFGTKAEAKYGELHVDATFVVRRR